MKKNASLIEMVAVTVLCSTFACADMTAGEVLNVLHETNHEEIHMGKIAQDKGSTSEVQSYGKTLVSDHQDNDKKVTDLATKDAITLKPTTSNLMDKMEMKHLQSLNGSDFDKAFAKEMIDGHKKAIEKLQSAQKSALPEDVRELVGNTLPTIQKHLETAQKIYGQPS